MKLITGYTGDNHVTGSDDAAFQNAIVGQDGILYGEGLFEYSDLNTTSVTIGIGEAVLNGVHCRCLSAESVNLSQGTDGKNRIDYLVIRHLIDAETLVESAEFGVVTGTETTGTPTPPELSKTSTNYEMELYEITWNGTSMITFNKVAPLIVSLYELEQLVNEKLSLTGGTVTGNVNFMTSPKIYGESNKYYVKLLPISSANGNRIVYTPNRTGVMVTIPYDSTSKSGTAVGDGQRPVYINGNGYVVECSELIANTRLKFNNYAGFIQNSGKQYMHIHASNEDNYGFVYGANRNEKWSITPYSGSHEQYIGTANYKWAAIYASNGAIQTSDRNSKHDIKPLDEKYIELFKKLIPVSFVFNSNSSGRTHVGFISQDVEAAMVEVGLSDLDFAGFCKDVKTEPVFDDEGEWMEERPVYDSDGNPEYIYSLRYDEFIAIVTRMVQIHEDRLNDIEERLARLEV